MKARRVPRLSQDHLSQRFAIRKVEAAGIEPLASSTGNAADRPSGGAESGALTVPAKSGGRVEAGLVAVIQAWPRLPDAMRAGILAMVRASN
jgi:hypothetical protein